MTCMLITVGRFHNITILSGSLNDDKRTSLPYNFYSLSAFDFTAGLNWKYLTSELIILRFTPN